MIDRLTGTLVEMGEGSCVIDVGGVGFEVGVSLSTMGALSASVDAPVTLYTRLRSKDEVPVLYGFADRAERSLFDVLVGVSGVGPKGALSVLSSFSPTDLAQIVADSDVARLTRAKGIGRKMASRLVLELASRLKADPDLRSLVQGDEGGPSEASGPESEAVGEARAALVSMGFTAREVDAALAKAPEDLPVEALLAGALRNLGGGR